MQCFHAFPDSVFVYNLSTIGICIQIAGITIQMSPIYNYKIESKLLEANNSFQLYFPEQFRKTTVSQNSLSKQLFQLCFPEQFN